jgi:hypothetical protein
MTLPTIRRLLIPLLAVVALGCGLAPKPKPNMPPLPSPSIDAEYLVHLTALDNKTKYIDREVDCTVIGKAANKVILITDTKTGLQVPYQLLVPLHLPQERRLRITDTAGTDRIEFVCSMAGNYGNSLDCETTVAATGKLAPMTESKDFDLIEDLKGGIAICSGAINTIA